MMAKTGELRWFLFSLYLFLFFTLPFAILFGRTGVGFGAFLSLMVLLHLRYQGTEKITKRLGAIPLSHSNAPVLSHLVEEHCRRRGLKYAPKLYLIPAPALNSATFGFNRRDNGIAITQGLWDGLSRDEMAQIVALHVDQIVQRGYICQSWLCQFLSWLDFLIAPPPQKRRHYPFRVLLRQALVLPLVLFPFLILRGRPRTGISPAGEARALPPSMTLLGALRKMEASAVRQPMSVSFSSRHLFLLPPRSREPIVRLLLAPEEAFSFHWKTEHAV